MYPSVGLGTTVFFIVIYRYTEPSANDVMVMVMDAKTACNSIQLSAP